MQRGLSIIETLVYISILAATFVLFTNVMVTMNKSYLVLRGEMALDSAAVVSLERMTREVRSSTSVDTSSILQTSPGTLVLNQTNDSGAATKATFSLVGQQLHLTRDGVDEGALVPPTVTVPNIIFYSIDSGNSKAVKIEMKLKDSEGGNARAQSYYATIILRGSYSK